MEPLPSSGIILAGGLSRRLGSDKAALPIDGQTLLARTVRILASVVDEVLVIGRSQAPDLDPRVRLAPDDVPGLGPLGGMLTGLRRVRSPYTLIVACDLPFLRASILRHLLTLAPAYQAVIPLVDGRSQPLHAVYARDVQHTIAARLAANELSVESLLRELKVRWVPADELESLDPSHRSFVNVNTRADWEAVLRLAQPWKT